MTEKKKRMVPSSNIYGAYVAVEEESDKFIKKEMKKHKENLCKYCPPGIQGLCCYWSEFVKGYQVVVDAHCEYFDEKTRKCTIYKERFEKNPNCLTIEQMKKLGTLPRRCPYVQFDSEYQKRKDLRLYLDDFEIVVKE